MWHRSSEEARWRRYAALCSAAMPRALLHPFFSLFDLLSVGGCIESEQLRVRKTGGAGARGGEARQWRRPATLCATAAPHALLHLSLSPPSSLFQRWMHREGVVEGEENRCSAGARGGEAMRWRKPTALRAAVAALCPRDPYLGQERH